MSEPRKILKNTAALAAANFISRIGNFLLIAMIARVARVDGLGVYAAAIAYHSLIAAAGSMGASSFLVREVARHPQKTWEYLVHFLMLGLCLAIVITCVFCALIPALGVSEELKQCLFVVLVAVFPGIANVIFSAIFIGHQRTWIIVNTVLVSASLNLVACAYLLSKHYGMVWLVGAFALTQFVVTLIYGIHSVMTIRPVDFEFRWSTAWQCACDIRTFAALSMVAAILANPELVLLSVLQSEYTVGVYAAALKVVNLWYFLPALFMTNVFPVLSRSYHGNDGRQGLITTTSMKYVLLFSLPIAAGMTVTADSIVAVLFGPAFSESAHVLRILAWMLPLNAVCAVLWRILAAQDRQARDLQSRLLAVSARLTIGVGLIVMLSVIGAAVAALVGVAIATVLLYYFATQNDNGIGISSLLVRIGSAAAVMACFAWWLDGTYSLWVVVPLSALTYVGAVFALGVLSDRDFQMIRKLWWRATPDGLPYGFSNKQIQDD